MTFLVPPYLLASVIPLYFLSLCFHFIKFSNSDAALSILPKRQFCRDRSKSLQQAVIVRSTAKRSYLTIPHTNT